MGNFRARNCPFRRTRNVRGGVAVDWAAVADVPGGSELRRALWIHRNGKHLTRFRSGVILERHGFIWKIRNVCCASAGLVSSTSTATIKSRFIELQKLHLRFNLRTEPYRNEPWTCEEVIAAHTLSAALFGINTEYTEKATDTQGLMHVTG